LIPGFRSPLFMGIGNRLATRFGRALSPPSGATLRHFLGEVEAFQRDAMAAALVPDSSRAAHEVARGAIELPRPEASSPRLIVAGTEDIFAPLDYVRQFASANAIALRELPGRGHWLIGGRALQHAVGEAHRFLVRELG